MLSYIVIYKEGSAMLSVHFMTKQDLKIYMFDIR